MGLPWDYGVPMGLPWDYHRKTLLWDFHGIFIGLPKDFRKNAAKIPVTTLNNAHGTR